MKGQNELEDALDDLIVNVTEMANCDEAEIQRLRAKMLIRDKEIERLRAAKLRLQKKFDKSTRTGTRQQFDV